MYKLHFSQNLPITLDEAWDFFSSPANLVKITPPEMSFKIKHHHENKKMYAGQILAYTLRPFLGITLEWVTEITAVQRLEYFIDEQIFGPYTFWHHEHWFKEIPEGIQMEDIIYYKMPFGIIGRAFHHLKVKQDLDNVFSYRKAALEQLFAFTKHS